MMCKHHICESFYSTVRFFVLSLRPVMIRWIYILLLTCMFPLLGYGHADASVWQDSNKERSQAEFCISQQNRQQAIVSDPTNVYRICSSRPGKINPVKPSQHFKTEYRCNPYIFNPQKAFRRKYCGRKVPSAIPILSMSVADRYVYRLRRIIC